MFMPIVQGGVTWSRIAIGALESTKGFDNGSGKTNFSGNFDGLAIGAASDDRIVVVGITGNHSGTGEPTSVTIGGVTATIAGSVQRTGENDSSMWYALVTTGTTADIDIIYTGTRQVVAIAVWSIYGASGAPDYTAGHEGNTTGDATVSLTIPANGFGCAANSGGGPDPMSVTWAGLTGDGEVVARTNSNHDFSSDNFSTLQSSLTVSATGSANMTNCSLATASWGPAE